MRRVQHLLRLFGAVACIGPLLAACSPVGLALSAAGVATDTSMTWTIVKHIHGKLTEDDPTPCILLNSVQRALNPRCEYAPGNIKTADIAHTGLQDCPLAIATRDPRLWRALPELMDRGATVRQCSAAPLVALAETDPCPDFTSASPEVRKAMIGMAENDPRAVQHDVFRMLGCRNARDAGLDTVLTFWLDHGALEPGKLSFSPLEAADPDLLVGRFGHELEVAGHRPEAALDGYSGSLPSGFEMALRNSNYAALDWWLYRLPQLANLAPPQRGGPLAWVPLQRVILPGYLTYPTTQKDMVEFLVARGASARQKLPFDPGKTVLGFAMEMKSPMVVVLNPPVVPPVGSGTTAVAVAKAAAPAGNGSTTSAATRRTGTLDIAGETSAR